jgi:hypothetical protein
LEQENHVGGAARWILGGAHRYSKKAERDPRQR